MKKGKKVNVGDVSPSGYLTVTNADVNGTGIGKTIIECICKCGTRIQMSVGQWNQGRRKSCGCRPKIREDKPIALGRQGFLQIISTGHVSETGKHYSVCICDCDPNKRIRIDDADLRKNRTSCGCRGRIPIGATFGRLTVIANGIMKDGSSYCRVRCSCEKHTEFDVSQNSLKCGNTKSCGCLLHESNHNHNDKSEQRLYHIWKGMHTRCDNPKVKSYKWYFAKGITYCCAWKEFAPFREWALSHGYSPLLTLDRIDGNKGYSPENCRWVTRKVQSNNKSDNVSILYKGERKNLSQWIEALNLNGVVVRGRIRKGWSPKEAFETPVGMRRR